MSRWDNSTASTVCTAPSCPWSRGQSAVSVEDASEAPPCPKTVAQPNLGLSGSTNCKKSFTWIQNTQLFWSSVVEDCKCHTFSLVKEMLAAKQRQKSSVCAAWAMLTAASWNMNLADCEQNGGRSKRGDSEHFSEGHDVNFVVTCCNPQTQFD